MRKKLFAILMSAMMMVTFMPAMAFAGNVTVTAKTEVLSNTTPYDTLKVSVTTAEYGYGEATYPITRTFDASSGLITADVSGAAAKLIEDMDSNPNAYINVSELSAKLATVSSSDNKTFYDFAGASLVKDINGNVMYQSFTRAQMGDSTFTGTPTYLNKAWAIKLVEPSYAEGYVATAPKKAYVGKGTFGAELYLKGYDADVAEAQDCTLVADFPVTSADAIKNNPGFSVAVKVAADTTVGTAAAAKFFVDKTAANGGIASADASSNANPAPVVNNYDGAAHKLVMKAGTGVTATYAKYNTKTSSWDAVDEIAWKDADTTGTLYKAVVTDSAKASVTFYFNVTVAKATINFELVNDAKTLYDGDECDPYDFVKFTASAGAASADSTKAIATDKEALLNFVKTYYNAKATDNGNAFALTLKEKTLTSAELKAKTAAEAKANWNVVCTDNGTPKTVTVYRNNKVNDITVTSLNKTVHVKKAKATKKAYTKTVKAETLAGTAKFKKVSGNSKITVASDGKITIKKGLKKGTYKVKVKAYVPEGLGYLYASTTEVVKVKVVK